MILWSQQITEITSIFHSFQAGKRVHVHVSREDQERDKLFLRPEKFESMTLSNFKILVYYHMFNNRNTSKIQLLKELNVYTKDDIKKTGKLRTDVLSYKFIHDKDTRTLETLNITPYEAYQKSLIHPFTLADYYDKHSNLVQGRLMTTDVKYASTLAQYFNFN